MIVLFTFLLGTASKIGTARIHQHLSSNRLASNQHPKSHLRAIRECQIDRPRFTHPSHWSLNHDSVCGFPARTANASDIVNFRDAGNGHGIAALNRMNFEADQVAAILFKRLDVVRVQAR